MNLLFIFTDWVAEEFEVNSHTGQLRLRSQIICQT